MTVVCYVSVTTSKLYQCVTLNFGARFSSYYRARAAGLLVRLIHRMIRVRHSAQIYVDDLLVLLESVSAPLWASLVAVLLLNLKVPLSRHKAALSPRVVWIRTFRPSLAPLYADQHSLLSSMTALQPELWSTLRAALSPDLQVRQSLAWQPCLRGGGFYVSANKLFHSFRICLLCLPTPGASGSSLPPRTRGFVFCLMLLWKFSVYGWISVNPARPFAHCFVRHDRNAQLLRMHGILIACGLGWFVRLPDGKQLFFQKRFSADDLHALFPWFPASASALASAQLDLFLWLFPRLWSSVSARDDIWLYSRRIDSCIRYRFPSCRFP